MGVPCCPSNVDVSHIAILLPPLTSAYEPVPAPESARLQPSGPAGRGGAKLRSDGGGRDGRCGAATKGARRLPSTPQLDSASVRCVVLWWVGFRGCVGGVEGAKDTPPPATSVTEYRIHTPQYPALMKPSNVIPSDSRPSPRQDRYTTQAHL